MADTFFELPCHEKRLSYGHMNCVIPLKLYSEYMVMDIIYAISPWSLD